MAKEIWKLNHSSIEIGPFDSEEEAKAWAKKNEKKLAKIYKRLKIKEPPDASNA